MTALTASKKRLVIIVLSAVVIVALILAAATAGLGRPGVPSDAVAIVDHVDNGVVTHDAYEHALDQTVAQLGLKDVPPPSDPQYAQINDQTMQGLLLAIWARGEAHDLGIDVTDQDVQDQLDSIKKSFKSEAEFTKVVQQSKFCTDAEIKANTPPEQCADVQNQARLLALEQKLTDAWNKTPTVTDQDIQDFYDANKSSFETPAQRSVRVILNKDQQQVNAAKQKLQGLSPDDPAFAKTWQQTAAKYSQDQASKDRGGLLEGLVKGQGDPQLDDQVFSAPVGQLVGPFKTDRGYYLIEVVDDKPASTQPLDDAKAAIKQQLVQARQQAQQQQIQNDFIDKWKRRTECIPAVMMQFCDGYVPPETTTPGAPTPPPVQSTSPIAPGTATFSVDGTTQTGLPQGPKVAISKQAAAAAAAAAGGVPTGAVPSGAAPATGAPRPRAPPRPRAGRLPDAPFVSAGGGEPGPASGQSPDEAAARRSGAAVEALDAITRRLRRECPWDREQDERSIVPHTVEEAYELADAAASGDDDKLADELGDVLFQVHFLGLLLEERGAGDMAAVAERMRAKLIRRHPHVFGDADARNAGEVLQNWDRIKREQEGREGLFADVPENLPALLYARKLQRRAANRAAAGSELGIVGAADAEASAAATAGLAAELRGTVGTGADGAPTAEPASREAAERAVGELLFAVVDVARRLRMSIRSWRCAPPRHASAPISAAPERLPPSMNAINNIHARQILDSRGNPTVEVDVNLEGGGHGRAAVPSGASTGEFEATELRDGGEAWGGKGVAQRGRQRQRRDRRRDLRRRGDRPGGDRPHADRARRDAEQVAPGRQRDPRRLPRGRPRRRRRRARCRSTATWRRCTSGDPEAHPTMLPVPMMNVLNGGSHADNSVDFQEFMIVPAGASSFGECLRVGDRGLPRPEGPPAGPGAGHRRRRRGRLRPGPGLERGGAGGARRGHRRPPATSPARTSSSRSTRRRARSTRTAPTCSSTRTAA